MIVLSVLVAAAPATAGQSDPGTTEHDVCTALGPADPGTVVASAEDPYLCRLPAWEDAAGAWGLPGELDVESTFRWAQETGDSLDPQGDIVAVAWAPVRLSAAQARAVREDGGFGFRGQPGRAIRRGGHMLIQVETAEAPELGAPGNLSLHLGTDRDGRPGNNVPASVANPQHPYQDLQDVYTVYLAAGSPSLGLYTTDFGSGRLVNGSQWYNGEAPFAARITSDPPGVQFLVPAAGLGATFRPTTFSDREATAGRGLLASVGGTTMPRTAVFDQDSTVIPTGADVGRLGTRLGLFPRSGFADVAAGCLEAITIHEPIVVDRLIEDGTTTEDVPLPSRTPVLWCTWPSFEDGDILAQWYNFADADGDGRTLVGAWLDMAERRPQDITTTIRHRQRVEVAVTLRGGNLYIGFNVGLRGYGGKDIEGIEFVPTGNPQVDAILGRSAQAAVGILPSWYVDESSGITAGDETCMPDGLLDELTTPR